MGELGTVFTAKNAAQYLWDNNSKAQLKNPFGVNIYGGNYWQDVYQNIAENERTGIGQYDFERQKAIAGYQGDFFDAALTAYESSVRQRAGIMQSGLGQGYKEKLYNELDDQLNAAYNQYINTYKSNTASANQFAEKGQRSVIDAANTARTNLANTMNTEATNIADYLNAHFDYLGGLWDKYEAGELDENFFAGKEWLPYVNYEIIGGINTPTGIKDLDEIKSTLFTDGELNEAGLNYIKFVQNMRGYDFGDYLSEVNPNLYNWVVSPNEYGSIYFDTAGVNTNRAAALASIGLYNTLTDEDGNEYYQVPSEWPNNRPSTDMPSVEASGDTTDMNVGDTAVKSSYLTQTYENSKDFGTVNRYVYDGNTINQFEGLTVSGVKDKAGNNFKATYQDGDTTRTYKLQFTPDGDIIDSGTIMNNIDKATGGIKDKQIYSYYDGKETKVYMGFVDKDGKKYLREISERQFGDSLDVLIRTVNNDAELSKSTRTTNASSDVIERLGNFGMTYNQIADLSDMGLTSVEFTKLANVLTNPVRLADFTNTYLTAIKTNDIEIIRDFINYFEKSASAPPTRDLSKIIAQNKKQQELDAAIARGASLSELIDILIKYS